MKQEKMENNTYQHQIKKLQGDLLAMDSDPGREQATKKILAEKESTIQLLKKKMKGKVHGAVFQIQEYSFVEVQEGGSSDRYK